MFRIHAKPKTSDKPPEVKAKPTAAEFLIETNILPLVLIGKGVKCFGWAAVLAFIFGAVSLWGYAAVTKTVPLVELKASLPTPTPATKMVRLSGIAREVGRDGKLQPITEPFTVAVVAKQQGQPGLDPEGLFFLEAPVNTNYDVLLWKTKDTIKFFDNIPAVQDNEGLKLQYALRYREPAPSGEISASRHPITKPSTELAKAFAEQ
jgi:hypothetical protein